MHQKILQVLTAEFDSVIWYTVTENFLSNEDGNANDNGWEKLHFWLVIFHFVRVIRVLFSPLWILWAENDGMFLQEAK